MEIRTRYIIVIILVAMLCFSVGYMAGTYVTIQAVASVARGFVDDTIIKDAIFRYQHEIKGLYP